MDTVSRRKLITGVGLSNVGIFLAGSGNAAKRDSKEVAAVEELKREHGVLLQLTTDN